MVNFSRPGHRLTQTISYGALPIIKYLHKILFQFLQIVKSRKNDDYIDTHIF